MKRLMTAQDWALMDILKPSSGNWGNWHEISFYLICELDNLCYDLGLIPLITSGTMGKHSEKSWHYKGYALDVMFPQIPLWELPKRVYESALRYEFTGIGIYNQWRLSKDVAPQGGIHVEQDPIPSPNRKLWLRTEDGDFKPSEELFDKYFPATL